MNGVAIATPFILRYNSLQF